MKIQCPCGQLLVDAGDRLPGKSHMIPDEALFDLYDGIDNMIERLGAGKLTVDEACMKIRQLLARDMRLAWHCPACGHLYIDRQGATPLSYVPSG